MRVLTKKLELNEEEFYKIHLSIVNAILPIKLTPKEIEVLATFMSLKNELANDRFGTTARKVVMDKLSLSPGGLGNYIKTLKEKGFIKNNTIISFLVPNSDIQEYFFQLKNIDNAKE